MHRRVFIDGCAVNRFALINVDPSRALAGSEFQLALTPDLAAEYRRALDHLFVASYVKALMHRLLETCETFDLHGFEPGERGSGDTDSQLIALSKRAIVITDDAKRYRRWTHAGLLPWPEVETHLRADRPLVDLLRSRAERLL